jgi:hypothetical protein
VESKLHAFNTQDISSLTWALAELAHYSHTLMQDICVLSERRLAYFTSSALAEMIFALSVFGYEVIPLFCKLWDLSTVMVQGDKEISLIRKAVVMMGNNGGIPVQLNPDLLSRVRGQQPQPQSQASMPHRTPIPAGNNTLGMQQQSYSSRPTNPINQASMNELTLQTAKVGLNHKPNGGSVHQPINSNSNVGSNTRSVHSVSTIDKIRNSSNNSNNKEGLQGGLQEEWHFSPKAGLLKMESFTKTESFRLKGESLISGLLDSQSDSSLQQQGLQDSSSSKLFYPHYGTGGGQGMQRRPNSNPNANSNERYNVGPPPPLHQQQGFHTNNNDGNYYNSNAHEQQDQGGQNYFSIWQTFMPEHTDRGGGGGGLARRREEGHEGTGGTAAAAAAAPSSTYEGDFVKLPSGRELVTPRSNLLSALSLDSSSGRTPFERSLFEQGL